MEVGHVSTKICARVSETFPDTSGCNCCWVEFSLRGSRGRQRMNHNSLDSHCESNISTVAEACTTGCRGCGLPLAGFFFLREGEARRVPLTLLLLPPCRRPRPAYQSRSCHAKPSAMSISHDPSWHVQIVPRYFKKRLNDRLCQSLVEQAAFHEKQMTAQCKSTRLRIYRPSAKE